MPAYLPNGQWSLWYAHLRRWQHACDSRQWPLQACQRSKMPVNGPARIASTHFCDRSSRGHQMSVDYGPIPQRYPVLRKELGFHFPHGTRTENNANTDSGARWHLNALQPAQSSWHHSVTIGTSVRAPDRSLMAGHLPAALQFFNLRVCGSTTPGADTNTQTRTTSLSI